jgi:lysophospholipase L1-like esterase
MFWAISLACFVFGIRCAMAAQQPTAAPDLTAEFIATALQPFWKAREIHEPVFFVEAADGGRPVGKLLFKPTEIVSVVSGTHETKFAPGRDYEVDLTAGTISIPPGSKIPVTTREQLYPVMTSNLPKIARKSGDRTRGIFFDEGAGYHKLQMDVTYRVEPGQWQGPTPKYAGESLPRVTGKLQNGEPLKIVLLGDSISTGANSSVYTKSLPGCPGFGELVALALEHKFGSKVTLANLAVDGTTSVNGLKLVKDKRPGRESPDLVIIAFGMNDVYYKHTVDKYQSSIRGMIEQFRADAPECEFILVAPMLANAERGIPLTKFPLYRDALVELCGTGVALADVTSIWEELLKRKSFYDLTGNGVNHPNDFGHCVYAQTILALVVKDDDAATGRK